MYGLRKNLTMSIKSILLVDDEINVLNSLSRSLGDENFDEIQVARNGKDALDIVQKSPHLALIISDFHMPGINGIDLLVQVRNKAPDITRILLTGAADLGIALDAINKGNIYRFLLKPCPSALFLGAIQDGLRQNELIKSERDLLNKTLSGSIKVMLDLLSTLNPAIFVQSARLRNLARDLSDTLYLDVQPWEIELAAMLSQVGAVTIPNTILERWQKGETLDGSDSKMIQSIPLMGKILINNIPRLNNIAEAVGYQNCAYNGPADGDVPRADNIPLLARILKVMIDFDRLFQKSKNVSVTFRNMIAHEAEYDPRILSAFRLMVLRNFTTDSAQSSIHVLQSHVPGYDPGIWTESRQTIPLIDSLPFQKIVEPTLAEKIIDVDGIDTGMVLSRDVYDDNGTMIVSKNTIVTDVLRYRLNNYFQSRQILTPVFILKDK